MTVGLHLTPSSASSLKGIVECNETYASEDKTLGQVTLQRANTFTEGSDGVYRDSLERTTDNTAQPQVPQNSSNPTSSSTSSGSISAPVKNEVLKTIPKELRNIFGF
jgi:hypothetical protein